MNRFANKVLQLGEANAELQVRSDATPPTTTNQYDSANDKLSSNDKITTDSKSDKEKVKSHDKTDSTVQSEQSTDTGVDKSRETSEVIVNSPEEGVTETTDKSMDSAAMIELEMSNSDWFITCHQFISGLLFEPDLCQFFAEQSSIDLSSNKAEDKLTPYTRSMLHSHQ